MGQPGAARVPADRGRAEDFVTILLAAGGTGGHTYPALALGVELRDLGCEVRWVGRPESPESRLAAENGFAFEALPAAGFFGRGVGDKAVGAALALAGFFRAVALLRRIRPDAVVATGGFASAALLAAAVTLGTAYFLLEQNCVPGRVTRFFARGARESFLGFEPAAEFPGPNRVTGNPLRRTIPGGLARADNGRTVLVLGGSGGARALSLAGLDAAAALSNLDFVILAGRRDHQSIKALVRSRNCEVVEYTDRPEELYRRSTIAVSRAGGMVLSELVAFGIPAILVPFPHATDRHQDANAACLARAGAATILDQSRLSGLTAAINSLMDDAAGRRVMESAARALARPDAGRAVAERILECLAA
jgi:UDP-N-acetylglucosamine--N-acetylmuramyl-(pentapeptide) pyrophosphoryl-undecaprenol N-acetylglucosamine transferase